MLKNLVLLVSFWCITIMSYGQVFVSAKIDTNQIYIGEQVLLKLKVTSGSGQVVVLPEYPDSQLIRGVEVLNHYTMIEEKLDGGRRRSVTEAYRITSFDSSLYYIPPIEVQVDGKTYKSSQGLALKVVSPNVDTTKVEKIFGPMGNAEVIYDWNDLKRPFYSWVIGLVMLIVAMYIGLQIKNNHHIVPKISLKPEGPPHKVALKHIDQLRKKSCSSNSKDIHQFYSELTEILRMYIAKRFGFKATAMTTTQIMERIKDKSPENLLTQLQELFSATDLIKYAGINSGDEGKEESLHVAVDYIDATKEVDIDSKKKLRPVPPPEVKRSYKMRIILTLINSVVLLIGFALICWAFYTVFNMLF